jgi:hypothetical protein
MQSLIEGFEGKAHKQDDLEFWYARDLQYLLRYAEWRNFLKVVEKAREACANAGHKIADHFVDVNKMVEIASPVRRVRKDEIASLCSRKLTRLRRVFASEAKQSEPPRLCEHSEAISLDGLPPTRE